MTDEEWREESLDKGAVSSDEKEIAEYAFEAGQKDSEAQIEKMKRCFNCKYHDKFVESKCGECEDYSKWEIKEK